MSFARLTRRPCSGLTYYVVARCLLPCAACLPNACYLTRVPRTAHFSLSWMPATEAVRLLSPPDACSIGGIARELLPPDALCRRTRAVGAAIFAFGTVHQAKCHRILAMLSASKQPARGGRDAGRRAYSIPRGDWFEFSSCAHYLVRHLCVSCFSRVARPSDLFWLAQGRDSDLRRPRSHLHQPDRGALILGGSIAAAFGSRAWYRRRCCFLLPLLPTYTSLRR